MLSDWVGEGVGKWDKGTLTKKIHSYLFLLFLIFVRIAVIEVLKMVNNNIQAGMNQLPINYL